MGSSKLLEYFLDHCAAGRVAGDHDRALSGGFAAISLPLFHVRRRSGAIETSSGSCRVGIVTKRYFHLGNISDRENTVLQRYARPGRTACRVFSCTELSCRIRPACSHSSFQMRGNTTRRGRYQTNPTDENAICIKDSVRLRHTVLLCYEIAAGWLATCAGLPVIPPVTGL